MTTPARSTHFWIFLVANYLYCDVLSLMDPTFLQAQVQGGPPGMPMGQGFLLFAGILMEIPIAMILLAERLPVRPRRRANIAAGSVMISVQVGSFAFGSAPTLHYWFFSAIEIATLSAIVWTAWKTTLPDAATAPGD